ncbi:MAG TPA: hypothetical protein VIV11_26565 [Kofleriaceae bacterium]
MRGLRMSLLLSLHVALVIASVFVMDWVIRDRLSADLWAVSQCSDMLCASRPLDDGSAAMTIWETLLFSSIVIWQGGSRALGFETSRWVNLAGYMVGAIGAMSVAIMTAVFARAGGMTSAPLVLAAAYVTGFAVLRTALQSSLDDRLATARASRRA